MKMPRALSLLVFAGCSPAPTPGPDGGMPDAGHNDGGTGPCVLNMSCDPGDGTMNGYCVSLTLDDGGTSPYCEMPV